uniref:Secreted protein n=1 Tax=Gopherus agassizii TaxID=38772 RepID=A0A452I8N3_9SAUR
MVRPRNAEAEQDFPCNCFFHLCLALLLPVVAGLDFSYHHSEQLETFLKGVHRQHPSITALRSIGRSVAGRLLLGELRSRLRPVCVCVCLSVWLLYSM